MPFADGVKKKDKIRGSSPQGTMLQDTSKEWGRSGGY